jgi:hypothetical protein
MTAAEELEFETDPTCFPLSSSPSNEDFRVKEKQREREMQVKMVGSYKRESRWGALMEEEKDLYLERKK